MLCESSLLIMAQAKSEAMKLADRGRFDEASALLENVAETIEKLSLVDSQVRVFIQELRELARRIRTDKDVYYTAHNRMRMYHDSSMILRDQRASYLSMIDRRNRGN